MLSEANKGTAHGVQNEKIRGLALEPTEKIEGCARFDTSVLNGTTPLTLTADVDTPAWQSIDDDNSSHEPLHRFFDGRMCEGTRRLCREAWGNSHTRINSVAG